MNGRYDDEYGGIDIWGEAHAVSIDYENTTPHYKYQFEDEESLITSKVFQKCLGQSLAHKDKIIRQLQEEILNGS